ncbi:hypothetical protein [Oceanicola sp. 502str15]|uniref:hypothetical protein n=1 Tax=Oceanicola sp. 502str15 TaxID=2696061 RepID=UPI0020955D08|nr:hypothetical protein [Oceanicola sp. 502str15]MCO6383759.1 hypothetical protein [Oceanicola sp. 502str15]
MFESFVELSEHIHELRAARAGRSPGFAMKYNEVWQAALDCPKNGISKIYLYEDVKIPKPFSGMFFRLESDGTNIGLVFVDEGLDGHWREFAIVKELMHCWSPGHTRVGTPAAAKDLVAAHVAAATPYPAAVAADNKAILAAAEVILPSYSAERYLGLGKTFEQIAFECGLDEGLVNFICRHDMLQARKNGHL